MIYGILLFLHIVVSLGLIMTVLMQSSKGGGLAGTFGGSGMTGGIFGGRGAAPFLARATTVFAILFMLTSLSLNYIKPGGSRESVFERTMGPAGAGSSPAVTDQMPVLPTQSGETQGEAGQAEPVGNTQDTGGAGE